MTIRVLSFDFDGCLFNSTYIDELKEHPGHYFFKKSNSKELKAQLDILIQSNKEFLEEIREQNATYDKVYTLVGSNRQSFATDKGNAVNNKTGSCARSIMHLSEFLEVTLDRFLLADIYGNKESGHSFNLILQEIEDRKSVFKVVHKHEDFAFDKTKATILYAQMHKIAMENPSEEIVFDFYDDREDILDALHKFYRKNPNLMPSNVTLNLNKYAGKSCNNNGLMNTVKGKGLVDMGYRQTVVDLAKQAFVEQHLQLGDTYLFEKSICVASHFKPSLLQRKKLIKPGVNTSEKPINDFVSKINSFPEESRNAFAKFMFSLNEIHVKQQELSDKSCIAANRSSKNPSYEKAAVAAGELCDAIFRAFFDECGINSDEHQCNFNADSFIQKAQKAIIYAKNSELKNHRGYLKQILYYTGLAILAVLTIATAGLAYGVAGGVNYACNGQFFFKPNVNTDSVNKVLDLEKAVGEFANCLPVRHSERSEESPGF